MKVRVTCVTSLSPKLLLDLLEVFSIMSDTYRPEAAEVVDPDAKMKEPGKLSLFLIIRVNDRKSFHSQS